MVLPRGPEAIETREASSDSDSVSERDLRRRTLRFFDEFRTKNEQESPGERDASQTQRWD